MFLIKFTLVHFSDRFISTTSSPSKIAKNVGAEVHDDGSAIKKGQKCRRGGNEREDLFIWKMIYYFISLRSRPLYSLMGKVLIQIDWVPHNFSAAPLNENIACVATGTTLEEVEKNIVEALRFHIEGMMVDGETLPEELASPWEPEFCLTTRALLKYTGSYITQKALAKETGIAEQQLSHYANGLRHPRPAMQQKIVKGIQSICKHLTVVL